MDFNAAAKFTVPFGKHRGVPLEGVLSADPSYLTWLAGSDLMKAWKGPFKFAFDTFMASPNVKTEIENRMIDQKHARQNWR